MIVLQGLRPTIAGLALGLAASLAAGRLLAQFVYGVGTSDPATADTAAALRTAGEACGEESGADADSGLASIEPDKPVAADQKKASCPPADAAGQATGGTSPGTPAGAPTSTPAVPATDPEPEATPAPPIGGGLQ